MKKANIRFDILTIFPEAFTSLASVSILKRAIEAGEMEFVLHDIRQHTTDHHRTVDDTPYGGGSGMLMKAAPIIEAAKEVENFGNRRIRIFLTPDGERLTQGIVKELSTYDQIIMVCGHYEGIDQRARDTIIDREISVGDYVLTGGELPAMIVCDAVSRLKEGVLGNEMSHQDETFENERLEYPQYTRPANYGGMKVPEVLLTGHHKKIKDWRDKESLLKTKKIRPDLLARCKINF